MSPAWRERAGRLLRALARDTPAFTASSVKRDDGQVELPEGRGLPGDVEHCQLLGRLWARAFLDHDVAMVALDTLIDELICIQQEAGWNAEVIGVEVPFWRGMAKACELIEDRLVSTVGIPARQPARGDDGVARQHGGQSG
jgi:hypothetical protein